MTAMTFEDFITSSELADVVQRNTETYRTKWQKMYAKARSLAKMRSKQSWNWAAFIFGGGWFFYRKMYLIGSVWAVACIGVAAADALLGSNHSIVYLALNLMLARFANALYFHHTYGRIAKARADGQIEELKAQGGASWISGIAASVAVFLITGLVAAYPEILQSIKSGSAVEETPASTSSTATPKVAAQSTGRDVSDPSGTYNFEETGYSGEMTVAQQPNGMHAVSIQTESSAQPNLCEIKTDAAVMEATALDGGARAVDLNWKDPDVDCSINIHFFGAVGAKIAASGDQCSGLCGTGVTFEGRYSKMITNQPASSSERGK